MRPSILAAIALCSYFGRMTDSKGAAPVESQPRPDPVILGASPSSIIVDELPQSWRLPRPASNLYGNPRPYLKRKKGRS